MTGRRRYPLGTTPWNPWHGVRIGGIIGGIVGVIVAQFFVPPALWIALVAAAGGGAIGYWSEYRKRR